MELVVVVLLCLVPATVWSCSCVPGSYNRQRDDAIRDDFCGEYSNDIYVATVEEATCNCMPMMSTDADLYCQSFTRPGVSTTVVNTETVAQGVCENLSEYMYYFESLKNCSDLVIALAGEGNFVDDVTTSQPVLQNITRPLRCNFVCPFNNDTEYTDIQPCTYMVEVGTVFKGNLQTGDTLMVFGPDVLTSCGYEGRVLSLNTQYVVGIGGPCHPINEWTALDDYTERDIALLTSLSENYNETDPSSVCAGSRLSGVSPLLLVALGVLVLAGFHIR